MKYITSFALLLIIALPLKAQFYTVRADALTVATGTIKTGVDISINQKWTLGADISYNPLKLKNFSINHAALTLNAKRWFYESFVGWYYGPHISLFTYDLKQKGDHYKGNSIAAGCTVGYQWVLSNRWSLYAEAGLGFMYLKYNRRQIHVPDEEHLTFKNVRKIILSPTIAGVGFSYLF
ncbi:MAG: DUF3575 domain-containing protein [Alistipes sp.]|nr:DUF3575 domain-containing protein [Alistipes sp.]